MSREIKFRAWTRQNPSMPWAQKFVAITGDGKQMVPIGGTFTGVWHALDDNDEGLIIEQYTGLTDKNGKEIYEGDIVKNIEGVNETAVCVWDESNAEFDFRCKDGKYTRDNVKSWLEMYEVIGNIHENKELLGGEE